jgi:hypothetical protein
METRRFVTAKELCAVLENMERRIQILRELFCSMGDVSLPVQDALVSDVEALEANSSSVSGTGCKPK